MLLIYICPRCFIFFSFCPQLTGYSSAESTRVAVNGLSSSPKCAATGRNFFVRPGCSRLAGRRAAAQLPPANCTNILVQLPYSSSSATAACPACPAQILWQRGEQKSSSGRGSRCRPAPRPAAPCLSILIIPVMSACPPALDGTGHPGPKLRLGDTNSLTGDRVQANLQIIYYWVSKFSGFWLYVGTCCPLPGWCPPRWAVGRARAPARLTQHINCHTWNHC